MRRCASSVKARRFSKPVSGSVRACRANSRWMVSCSSTTRTSAVTEPSSTLSSLSQSRSRSGRQITTAESSPNRVELRQTNTDAPDCSLIWCGVIRLLLRRIGSNSSSRSADASPESCRTRSALDSCPKSITAAPEPLSARSVVASMAAMIRGASVSCRIWSRMCSMTSARRMAAAASISLCSRAVTSDATARAPMQQPASSRIGAEENDRQIFWPFSPVTQLRRCLMPRARRNGSGRSFSCGKKTDAARLPSMLSADRPSTVSGAMKLSSPCESISNAISAAKAPKSRHLRRLSRSTWLSWSTVSAGWSVVVISSRS